MIDLITKFTDSQKNFWNKDFEKKLPAFWHTALSGMATLVGLEYLSNKSLASDLSKVTLVSMTKDIGSMQKAVVLNFTVYIFDKIIKNRLSAWQLAPIIMGATFLYSSTVIGCKAD